ncbi:MGH1-like glycoside hydrolase domain-containing protein [Ereboglobus luteus]|uniref:MGH1-like glycoside hydrolase domain-containing protein n=1 Tax=Ereboglobus luteus TaxID=1796921 RepID=UPI00192DB8C6|nr:trehalase family glycosidase [Ereboglobus luteus]
METRVEFNTSDSFLGDLYAEAVKVSKTNEKDFSGRPVLIEGGGYNGIWIETQPMGGEMNARRNMTTAFNNTLLFMEHQLPNGRYPGLIRYRGGKMLPVYSHTQGYSFPFHALNLYYWNKKRDDAYLRRLYDSMEKFDDYLWRYRDSDGDGCLETWCVWDTGEDNSNRFAGTKLNHGGWSGEAPPDDPVFPVESMDVMAYSYDTRATLARLSVMLGNGKEREWQAKAATVRDKLREYLWDEKRGACFDRDRDNKVMPALIHNNLRVMYHGMFTPEMAGRFVREHLLNPEEFWTPFPLPSIAINDPAYRVGSNDWSGEPMGLTYQRVIRALENYGFNAELVLIGEKLIAATGRDKFFTQQYDPRTSAASPVKGRNDYGPTLLAALEYMTRFYGVNVELDELHWGALGREGHTTSYTQHWAGDAYTIESKDGSTVASINGREIFRTDCGVRVDTDWRGTVLRIVNLRPDPVRVRFQANGRETTLNLKRNEAFAFSSADSAVASRRDF